MKEPFNNNLPTQTNDVIVNPENPVNPDSKPYAAAHSFPNHRFKLITPAVPKRHTFTK
jgi:hypothetical protein